MATGNAIVTTKHNYLEKIISEKHGETIQIKDSSQIVDSIKKLFTDHQKLQVIQNNNLMLSKSFTLENHLSKLLKIFNS
jgi:glycosyltransferase involved in cell wall biosynthesis